MLHDPSSRNLEDISLRSGPGVEWSAGMAGGVALTPMVLPQPEDLSATSKASQSTYHPNGLNAYFWPRFLWGGDRHSFSLALGAHGGASNQGNPHEAGQPDQEALDYHIEDAKLHSPWTLLGPGQAEVSGSGKAFLAPYGDVEYLYHPDSQQRFSLWLGSRNQGLRTWRLPHLVSANTDLVYFKVSYSPWAGGIEYAFSGKSWESWSGLRLHHGQGASLGLAEEVLHFTLSPTWQVSLSLYGGLRANAQPHEEADNLEEPTWELTNPGYSASFGGSFGLQRNFSRLTYQLGMAGGREQDWAVRGRLLTLMDGQTFLEFPVEALDRQNALLSFYTGAEIFLKQDRGSFPIYLGLDLGRQVYNLAPGDGQLARQSHAFQVRAAYAWDRHWGAQEFAGQVGLAYLHGWQEIFNPDGSHWRQADPGLVFFLEAHFAGFTSFRRSQANAKTSSLVHDHHHHGSGHDHETHPHLSTGVKP